MPQLVQDVTCPEQRPAAEWYSFLRDLTGNEQYSMIHMQPRDSSQLETELGHGPNGDTSQVAAMYSNTQEILLERDIRNTLGNIFPGGLPQEYIMLPSQETSILHGLRTQLVGVGTTEGQFDFYKQTFDPFSPENPPQVERLPWTQLQPPEQHPNPQLHINLA